MFNLILFFLLSHSSYLYFLNIRNSCKTFQEQKKNVEEAYSTSLEELIQITPLVLKLNYDRSGQQVGGISAQAEAEIPSKGSAVGGDCGHILTKNLIMSVRGTRE